MTSVGTLWKAGEGVAEKDGILSRSHVHPPRAETFADSCVAGPGGGRQEGGGEAGLEGRPEANPRVPQGQEAQSQEREPARACREQQGRAHFPLVASQEGGLEK